MKKRLFCGFCLAFCLIFVVSCANGSVDVLDPVTREEDETIRPVQTAPPETPLSPDATCNLVAHTESRKFHLATCYHASRIQPENRLELTATPREMAQNGYSPCLTCLKSVAADLVVVTTAPQTTPPETEAATAPPFDPDAVMTFVVHTGTGKFHLPTCPHASRIVAENRLEKTASANELVERGFDPCKTCLKNLQNA